MWLFRSVLVWILVCTIPVRSDRILEKTFRNLVFVSAILAILHAVTRPYKSSATAVSALRSRMFASAVVIPFAKFAILIVPALFLGAGVASKSIEFKTVTNPAFGKNASLQNVSSEENSTSILVKMGANRTLTIPPNSTALNIGILTSVMVYGPTVSAIGMWFFSQGYLSMVTTFGPTGIEVEVARVRDVVTYAITGTLGMLMGEKIVSVLDRLGSVSQRHSASTSIWRYALVLLNDLLYILVVLSSQVLVALAVAEKHVLGSRSRIVGSVLLVWAVLVIQGFQEHWFAGKVKKSLKMTTVILILIYNVCAYGYFYWSQRKTRLVLQAEEARTRARRTNSILSSTL